MLDRLLMYLRVVHSVDYYNHCEYPNEDEMPNRCGIMHARGSSPTSKVRAILKLNTISTKCCLLSVAVSDKEVNMCPLIGSEGS